MDCNGIKYAKDVVSGKIVAGEYVRLACRRFLDDMDNPEYYFNWKKLKMFQSFSSLLKHYTSGAAGKPFILEPWEEFIICNIFCLYRTDTQRRKYKTAHISVARKNGKSSLSAVITLFAFIADGEPAAECILAANSRDQSKIDLDMCQTFAHQLDPKEKDLRIYRNEIKNELTNSKLKNISADSSTADGLNISLALVDELECAKDSKMYDVLKSSMGFREQPLMMSIGTAGFDKNGFCYEFETYCKDVLKGVKNDDTLFAMIYCMDEGDEWEDERNWIKANPNLGVTVKKEWLAEQVQQAKNSPTLATSILTKNLQMWVSSSNIWIPSHIISDSMVPVDMSDFIDKKNYLCYGGFDLASVSDLTALSFLFIDPDAEEYIFKTFYYLPKTALDGKFNSELYKVWANRGYLILTDSPTTDYNYIKNQILYWYEKLDITKISYDSWNASQLVNDLNNEGLPMKPYSQSIGNFNRPTKELERLLLSGKVKIDKNPITRFCFDNVELKVDINGNSKPIGDHMAKKIDGVISILNSLGGYLDDTYGYGEAFVIPTKQ